MKPAALAASPRLKLWLMLAAILLVVATIRVRLLDFPLERDEGEYAYAGQLMLQGVAPYVQAYNMKWPGTYAAYAVIMSVFGQTTAGIHLGLLLVNLATAVLVFRLTQRICGDVPGMVAAGTYAFLSISPPTLGLAAHATHFVVLPALGGILLLQRLAERTAPVRIFTAGLLIGLSILMKQAGAAFGVFGALWVAWQEITRSGTNARRLAVRLGALALGGVLPFVLMCAILASAGVFDRFWHWTIVYASAYASILTPAIGMQILAQAARKLFNAAPGLWSLGLLGLSLFFFTPSARPWRGFILGFTVFSFLAVCPGWYFRPHYFILLLPAVGLLAGLAVKGASELLDRTGFALHHGTLAGLLFGAAAVQSLWTERAIFFELTPEQASRAVYGANPFPESVEVAKFLEKSCPPGATIAVIGSEPQLYFYSHRRSATGYIYTYPLMEPQPLAAEMQEEMIREIEAAKPGCTVFVSVASSWLHRPDSHQRIFSWFRDYREKLRLIGLVEILSMKETEYHWSIPPDTAVQPRTNAWIAVFENQPAS